MDFSSSPRATLDSGVVAGLCEDGVRVFKGVPFAAPPVGALRWRPPQPVQPWPEPRLAVEFGPAPLQGRQNTDTMMYHANGAGPRELVISEDCLYLNVWTPDDEPGNSQRAVMVWLHGGGNRRGHGGQDIHNGAALAARGIVVITLNYRVGALGFLAHPELAAEDEYGASGNYGLLDIVAALQWVQRNIAAFGGDPGRVTVVGHSAGAAHITHLMAAPAARDLFRGAIAQSYSGIYRADGEMPDQASAQAAGIRYVEGLASGTPPSIERLRKLSGLDLLTGSRFAPIVDGRLLARPTREVFEAGDQAPIPLLTGTNTDEGSIYSSPDGAETLRRLAGQAPDRSQFGQAYPTDPAHVVGSARLFAGEVRFTYPVWRWTCTHAATSLQPTWMYRFDGAPPLPDDIDLVLPPDGVPGYGAFHSAEVPYMFDNLRRRDWPWREADRQLARTMADTWVRFIEGQDPGGPPLPSWKPFDGTDEAPVMVLGPDVRVRAMPRIEAMHVLGALPRPI
jgi:para-nitrobenzyl esterase